MRRGETTRTGRAMLCYADKLRSGAASGHVLERPAKDRQTKLVYREVRKAGRHICEGQLLMDLVLKFLQGSPFCFTYFLTGHNSLSRSQLKWIPIPFEDRVKTKKKLKSLLV